MNFAQIRFYQMMIGFMKEIMDDDTPESRIEEIEKKLPAIYEKWGDEQLAEEIKKRRTRQWLRVTEMYLVKGLPI